MRTLNKSMILKTAAPAILAMTLFLFLPGTAQAETTRSVGIELGVDGVAINFEKSYASSRDPVVVVPMHASAPRPHYAPVYPHKGHYPHYKPAPRFHHGPKFSHTSRPHHTPKFGHGPQPHYGKKFAHGPRPGHRR